MTRVRTCASGNFSIDRQRLFVLGDFVITEHTAVTGDFLLHSLDEIVHFPLSGTHRTIDFEVNRGGMRVAKATRR